jgi:AcrR family transcriptional regulator
MFRYAVKRMGRPREHDQATRERLLQAAEHLSATQGFEAITVRAVAQEAGTSTRAVYALFGSKDGLEQALHEAMFTRLRDLLAACPQSDDPREDIVVQSLAYRTWAIERPERHTVAVRRFVGRPDRPRSDEGAAAARAALDELRHAVHRCHEAGQLRPELDPEEVMIHVRAVAHGLAEFENLGLLHAQPERQWRAAVAALLAGYAPSTTPVHDTEQAPAA